MTDAGPRSARCTTSTGSASYTSAVIVPTGCGRRCPRRAGRSGSSRRMRPHRSPPRPAKPHGGSGREGHGLKAPAFRPGAPWPRGHRRPDPYLGRALRGQDGGVPDFSPVPARTRIPNTGSQRGFSAGTMAGCAGSCRHDVPSCRQDPAAAAPGRARFMDIKCDSTVSDQVRPGRTRMTDRTSEPDRHLDREPPRGPVFKLGLRHGNAPDPPRSPDHHDNRSRPLRSRCLRGPCDHCGAGQIRTTCPTGTLVN